MTPRWYAALGANDRRAFRTTFAGFCLNSLDVQLYAFVLPTILGLWQMTHGAAGLLTTVALVASAVGGWVGGFLADRLGRIRLLRATILGLASATALCGLAADFDQLFLARILQGFSFGAEWTIAAVFIAETASPDSRGRMVGAVQSGWAIGWGLAGAISLVALAVLPPDLGWRATFFVGIVPAIVIFRLRLRLKESPVFQADRLRSPISAIFAKPIVGSTIKGSLLASGMHGGYWAVATWWPTILRTERQLSATASALHLGALIAGSLLGYFVGAWLADFAGRRMMLAGFAIGGAAMILICTELSLSDTALLVLAFPLGFFALGMFSVIGAVLTELFPTEMRGSGLGFCYNFGRGLAGATPFFVGSTSTALGLGHALGFYVTSAYGLVVVAAILLPETRGRRLDPGGSAPPIQPRD
ncbi:MAG TPA: MFS transporter [Kaistia sp.]|nr:MFS transporter [Kaistia sp.]